MKPTGILTLANVPSGSDHQGYTSAIPSVLPFVPSSQSLLWFCDTRGESCKPDFSTDLTLDTAFGIDSVNEMIDSFIYFCNHEHFQLKTGVAPLTLRHSV